MKRRSVLQTLGGLSLVTTPRLLTPADSFFDQWMAQYVKRWVTSKEYSLKILDGMPEDQFGYKPSEEQMSFGKQFSHFSYWNSYYLSIVAGEKPMAEPASHEKEAVRPYLVAVQDRCLEIIKSLPADKFYTKDLIDQDYWRDHTSCDFLMRAYMHTTHHRAQAIMYLRNQGVTPVFFMY